MVLGELGGQITKALAKVSNAAVIDQAVLDEFLKDIARALLQSDVNVAMIKELRENIKKKVNMSEMAAGLNKRKVIEKAVFDELCAMLDSKQKPPDVKKGKRNVIMFVGL